MQSAHDAVTLGERLAHVPTLVHGYMWTALAYRLCRDLPSVRVCSERLITLGAEHKLQQYHAIGDIWSGWASVQRGKTSEGISVLRQGLAGHTAQAKLLSAPFYAMLAEAYYMTGDSRLALDAIDCALDISERNSELFLCADMLRLRGQILLASSADRLAEAEACYRRALDISRAQNAKSLELRIVISMGRLWRGRGAIKRAYELIAPVYGWFTEGFDTPDLVEAQLLLDDLRS